MQVSIDGVPYAPACNLGSRIGIAITTHNRPAVLAKTIEQHLKHLPASAMMIVIDAGSAAADIAPVALSPLASMNTHFDNIVTFMQHGIEVLGKDSEADLVALRDEYV